jgi:hypothetical protein
MPRVEFEPAIPATKRPQTYALDRAATGIGLAPFLLTTKMAPGANFKYIPSAGKTKTQFTVC